ncbi:MAG: hypothetical protein CMM76_16475 [Rhodospirillaceae bacterium]|nr:hypothetical protein [Rhodospirillaceae bacterium]
MNYSDDSYYVAWIPPNPEFDERVAYDSDKIKEMADRPLSDYFNQYNQAQSVSDQLNRETKGAMGRYEVRRWVITERA